MSLYKQPNCAVWYCSFSVRGKRYRLSTGETTKSAAQTFEAQARTALSAGVEPPSKAAKTPTLREFSTRVLAWAKNSHELAANTRRYYNHGMRLLLMSSLCDTPLDCLTREVVDCTSFERPIYDRKRKEYTGEKVPCSATYTAQALRTLSVTLGLAVEWEVIRKRPAFSRPRTVRRTQTISADTEIRLEKQFTAPSDHPRHQRLREQAWLVMVILQDTGMRPEEVFSMQIENIDWPMRRIWVPEGKTENSQRWVGMSERMRALLVQQTTGRSAGWVFPSERSKSGHLESIAKGWQAARLRAGLDPTIVPYLARHTYATYQMQATGNVFAVSRSMGHADIKSMEPYQHPATHILNDAIDLRNQATEQRRRQLLSDGHSFGHSPKVM